MTDLIDVTCQIHHETDKAVLVSDDGERKNAKWLPRSVIEIEPKKNGIVEITMTARLAAEKGFI